MEIFRKVWPVMMLLLCFIRNTRCQFCKAGVPVARVCTNDSQISTRNVYIDTVSVPRYVNITCKCEISTSGINGTFEFVYSGNTDHTWYKLNEHYIYNQYRAYIYDTADLSFTTNDSIAATGCLNISTGNTTFNITCFQTTIYTTTNSIERTTFYSSGGITSVTEAKVAEDRKKESETDIIIPIVAAIASVVCIAGVVTLVVVCRRRLLADKHKSETSTTVVEKEKEDEYYMTENPMYDATDAEPNLQSAESHYIECENKDVSMPDCQYESTPDSPVTCQFQDNRSNTELHYDYTTCASSKAKHGPMLAYKVNQNNIKKKKVREQEIKLTAGDTIYDRTDTAAAKTFVSVNDYNHISPALSRKRVANDIYSTFGEAKNRAEENDMIEDDSKYHVTNVR